MSTYDKTGGSGAHLLECSVGIIKGLGAIAGAGANHDG